MGVRIKRSLDPEAILALDGGLEVLVTEGAAKTLGSLPVGSRLIIRSQKDWRTAVVKAITEDRVTLSVASPSGYTYRMYRPSDTLVALDGAIPLLGDGVWRTGLARYDVRW